MPYLRVPTLLLSLGLVLALTQCEGDDAKKVVAGDAGAGGEQDEPASGGSSSSAGSASEPVAGGAEGVSGGAGGAPGAAVEAGSGGSAGSPDAGGQNGAGGQDGAGGACTAAPDPTNCCQATDPVCVNNWELECYNDWNVEHFCCDPVLGIRRGCSYDGDFYSLFDEVCVDECTGKSFGTDACLGCFSAGPACPARGCGVDATSCNNAAAGYSLDCSNGDRVVTCVCNPDLD